REECGEAAGEEGRRSRCRPRPDRRQTSPDERPHGDFAALSAENDTGIRHPIGMTGITGGGATLPPPRSP
ncbi:MAG: hypothetical protein KDK08_25800, partial [Rhizobiaceae bacterium]|nr:hypothetical protein [Rhizobiaceae bacterium]